MKSEYKSEAIALVVCKNSEGKWLVVEETGNRGLNLPVGKVEDYETYHQAAIRETLEETGIDIELVGVLRVEYGLYPNYFRLKSVFFGVPKDEKQKPKTVPDKHSVGASWMSTEELEEVGNKNLWRRCPELYDWACYLDNRGVIYPLSNMQTEGKNAVFQNVSGVKTSYSSPSGGSISKTSSELINEFMQALDKSDESWFLKQDSKQIFNSAADASGNTMLHLASLSTNANFIRNCIFLSERQALSAVNNSKMDAVTAWKQAGVNPDLLAMLMKKKEIKLDNSEIF